MAAASPGYGDAGRIWHRPLRGLASPECDCASGGARLRGVGEWMVARPESDAAHTPFQGVQVVDCGAGFFGRSEMWLKSSDSLYQKNTI
jgi:hypothetical protein